jgi:hypothetical protein
MRNHTRWSVTITMTLEVTVGPPVVTINNGHTFLVSELDGSIARASNQGLDSSDTRSQPHHSPGIALLL